LKKIYAIPIVVIIVATLVGAYLFLSFAKPMVIYEGFETAREDWSADADVPLDPNNPGNPVRWEVERVANLAHAGNYSLKLFIDGKMDDGTIWIERKIDSGKGGRIAVDLSFWLWSEEESFNTIAAVCAYIGTSNPEAEGDFVVLGAANEVAGWKDYSYRLEFDSGSSGEFWVAVGISVRWETEMTYFIDDIQIEVR
jgi:hypothetical protein